MKSRGKCTPFFVNTLGGIKILKFIMADELQALTGLPESEAKKLLEANNGDLARAADQFFNRHVAAPAPDAVPRADAEASRRGDADADRSRDRFFLCANCPSSEHCVAIMYNCDHTDIPL